MSHFRNPRIITLSAHDSSVSFECMVYRDLLKCMVKFVSTLVERAGTNFTESRPKTLVDLCKLRNTIRVHAVNKDFTTGMADVCSSIQSVGFRDSVESCNICIAGFTSRATAQ